jgi:hypothetical protein
MPWLRDQGTPSVREFFSNDLFYAIAAIGSVHAAIMHSQRDDRNRASTILVWVIVFMVAFVFISNTILPEKNIDFGKAVSLLVMYGSALYAGACGMLRRGLAAYLTRKRGPKWIKEMDYVYLTLGAIGVVGSMNRADLAGGHYTLFDLFAPLIVATAIAIRLVKTRADIAGWNTPTA